MNLYWLEQIETDVPANNDWLSSNEAFRLNALRFPKRRADWRLGRWTAKCALSAYLDIPDAVESFSDIEILPAPDGAPEALLNGQPARVTISLSHSAGRAICAVASSNVRLGCDLEMVEPRGPAFIGDYFIATEQAGVARAPAEKRDRLVTTLWSAKESALKALRAGLRLDTRSVIVDPLVPSFSREGWSPLSVRYVGQAPQEDCLSSNRVFNGWWQDSDNIVRTLLAAPAPDAPILLKVPQWLKSETKLV